MKKKGTLLVQQAGVEYRFFEIDHTENDRRGYLGKVYSILQKDSSSYAIIFDNLYDRYIRVSLRQPGLISHPILLAAGQHTYGEKSKEYIKEVLESSVLAYAKKVAREEGLELKLELSQPKCTWRSHPFNLQDVPRKNQRPLYSELKKLNKLKDRSANSNTLVS